MDSRGWAEASDRGFQAIPATRTHTHTSRSPTAPRPVFGTNPRTPCGISHCMHDHFLGLTRSQKLVLQPEAEVFCGRGSHSSGHLKQTARHRGVAPRSQFCTQGLYTTQGPRPKRWTGVWCTKCQMRMPIQRSRHSSILVVSMISFCRAAGIHQFTM